MAVGEILTIINGTQGLNKNHIKMTVYEIFIENFTNTKLFKQPKEDMWKITVDTHAEYVQRMHF